MSFDREAERLLMAADNLFRHGRDAVINGELERGRQLLTQAVEYDRNHSQAWLWLSATTEDLAEQRQYLEWAVAADPANTAAKRGLGIVLGKIRPEDLLPSGHSLTARLPQGPQQAKAEQTFMCPQCGGRLRYDAASAHLVCDNCGYQAAVDAAPANGTGQVLDYALPTVQGHRWAEAERLFVCQHCSASTLLPPGQTATVCPFCGAAAMVRAPEDAELIPPQAIVPMNFEADETHKAVQDWLGRGAFMPDDLVALSRDHRLRAVYVPFWSFDASLSARWRAKVQVNKGRGKSWEWRTGERTMFFTNHLQPGSRGLPAEMLRAAEPFDLKKAVEFAPAFLAGWPAGTYDVSLAQASLEARPVMIERARRTLRGKAVPDQTVAELEITGSDFTGQTYKLVLLPFWIGTYLYQKKTYRVLVNGQTGKVAGDKPVDWVVIALIILAVFVAVIPLLTLLVITRVMGG